MQATQRIVEMEDKLLDLYEKQHNQLLINRVILAMMVLVPLYEIYLHHTSHNYLLFGIYILMMLVYLTGVYLLDQYLGKTVIGVGCGIIMLEIIVALIVHEPLSLVCIQLKFFILFGLLKVYFNTTKIAAMKKDAQFSQKEIQLIRKQLDNNYKKTLQGLRVYVNPQYY